MANKSTGDYNTAVGHAAGWYASGDFTGSNNTYLGYNARPESASESDTIRIGNSNQTATYIAGINGRTSSGGVALCEQQRETRDHHLFPPVQGGHRGHGRCEQRPDAIEARFLLLQVRIQRRPPHSAVRPDRRGGCGVYPELVLYDPKTGEPQTVAYHLVNAMLLNEVQRRAAWPDQATEGRDVCHEGAACEI